MNETIKSMVINYMCCTVLGGVVSYLSPEKSKKTVKVIVVALIVSSLAASVLNIDLNLDNLNRDNKLYEEKSYDNLMHISNITEKKIYQEFKALFINLSINEYEIYVDTKILEEENTVVIEKIRIDVGKVFKDKIPLILKNTPKEYLNVLEVGVKNE